MNEKMEKDFKDNDALNDNTEGYQNQDFDEPEIPVAPPVDPPFHGIWDRVAYFGFSSEGRYHTEYKLPCQDRCFRVELTGTPWQIFAISDGLGSCALSDIGAHIAVHSSANKIRDELMGKNVYGLSKDEIHRILRLGMKKALDDVSKSAEEAMQLLYSYQSTLTVALYDGATLHFAHVGDGGIVGLDGTGKLKKITSRHKGERQSSVYPLQSEDAWEFGSCEGIFAIMMATDGVFDSVVSDIKSGEMIDSSFFKPIFTAEINMFDDAAELCRRVGEFMDSADYRREVSDDITIVSVINTRKASALFLTEKSSWKNPKLSFEGLGVKSSKPKNDAPFTDRTSDRKSDKENEKKTEQKTEVKEDKKPVDDAEEKALKKAQEAKRAEKKAEEKEKKEKKKAEKQARRLEKKNEKLAKKAEKNKEALFEEGEEVDIDEIIKNLPQNENEDQSFDDITELPFLRRRSDKVTLIIRFVLVLLIICLFIAIAYMIVYLYPDLLL